MLEKKKDDEKEVVEISIPVIGLVKGVWVMTTCAFAFIGTAFVFTYAVFDPTFNIMAKSILGALVGATLFGTIFGVSRYFTEEQIKYIVVNMKLQ